MRGFTAGFSLNFEGQRVGLLAKNSATARRNVDVALDKINKEINLGRIAGSFNSLPFPNLKCTPPALREKSTPGESRLLHNLSYPYNERSVNLCIPDKQMSVKYASLNDAISVLKKHQEAFMAKADIKVVFRLIPPAPEDYPLTEFHLMNNF